MQTVLVPKKRDLKFLFKSLDILNNTINTKSTPFCKNVAILLQHRARSGAMHKFRRIKMSGAKMSPRAKVSPRAKESPCKYVNSC